jgi:4-amino-4-deoxy-L-arabinose transferase-like glycosyltransferase
MKRQTMTDTTLKTPRQRAYLIIALLAVFSLVYNAFLPLHGDEAYYWVWSHHLQGGYYDHPPMIAYMIALSNLISESEWGVRLVNVVSMSIAALYLYRLAALLKDEETALTAVSIFASIVLVHAGFTLTTPDSPLILFWTLSLFYGYRALFIGERTDFLLTGLFVGAMMLSKYSAILFVVAVLLFVLLKRRKLLFGADLWLAVIAASAVVSPLLWWNYQHDWISFAFQLAHGSSDTFAIRLDKFFEFFGGQFAVFTPVFAALLFFYLLREKRLYSDEKLLYITLSVLVPLLFFFYKSLFKGMELNYAAPAYIGGTLLVAWLVRTRGLKKSYLAGIALALFLSVVARIGLLFWLEVVQDRMYGNKEAVALLHKYAEPNDAFYADHLTTAALLTYYLPTHPLSRIPTPTRFSQYDMWDEGAPLKNGLYLSVDPMQRQLEKRFYRVALVDTLVVPRHRQDEDLLYLPRLLCQIGPRSFLTPFSIDLR